MSQAQKDTARLDELEANLYDIERALRCETDPARQNELSLEADGLRREIQNLIRGSEFLGSA
jgi:hypothetical protein